MILQKKKTDRRRYTLQARFGDDTVEVGFALPPLNGAKSPKEFIAEVTFPLPYGFTAIEMNTHGTDTSYVL